MFLLYALLHTYIWDYICLEKTHPVCEYLLLVFSDDLHCVIVYINIGMQTRIFSLISDSFCEKYLKGRRNDKVKIFSLALIVEAIAALFFVRILPSSGEIGSCIVYLPATSHIPAPLVLSLGALGKVQTHNKVKTKYYSVTTVG